MKCPACKENAEFVEVGTDKSRCQNCNALVNNEDLEPEES
jgi:transposase-like protein